MTIYQIFIFLLLPKSKSETFRVCGHYCGPGWCNNKWIPESQCDYSVTPEYHNKSGMSCTDNCCKHHDECCGQQNNTQSCNLEIVNCLKKCSFIDDSCTYNLVPVPNFLIKDAMYIVEDWCCGHPC